MSQEQPQKPKDQEPIKYGDVFQVSGDLANKPITPQDAATMQAAENILLGKTQKSGPAAVMQSAASVNENRGVVGHYDVTSDTGDQGVTVSEAEVAGHHIITESIGGQVVGQYVRADPISATTPEESGGDDKVTIGEALEAAAISAGEKPIEQSDVAAIQAAEVRASGQVMPSGVAAKAQAAASQNARTLRDEDKTKLGDVLADASTMLPRDKAVTRDDAEGVIGAEIRNQPELSTYPGGVAASIAAAARLNENKCTEKTMHGWD